MGNEELDELIAEALCSYSAAEPQPGLERRVLNQVAVARPVRWRFLLWGFGTAVVVVSLVAVLIRPVKTPVRQETPEVISQTAAVAPVIHPQIPVRRSVSPSRRDDFWVPAPLTDHEKALVALVERAPLQAEELLSNPEPQPIEPITIEELSIPPLEENGQ